MTLELPREYILFDTEYTSWADDRLHVPREPWQHKEIIQIGALYVVGLEEKESFEVVVKPTRNPQLSDFIIELTGITQNQVDEGAPLEEAVNDFYIFSRGLPVYAYGSDNDVVQKNCELVGIPYPFKEGQCHSLRSTLKPLLEERDVDADAYTSGTLIEAFGKKGEPAHDALSDMRNLLEVLKLLQ